MFTRREGTEYQTVTPCSRASSSRRCGTHVAARGAITQVEALRAMLNMSNVDRSKLRGEGQRIRSSDDSRKWRADQSTKAPTARCEIVTPFGGPGGPGAKGR